MVNGAYKAIQHLIVTRTERERERDSHEGLHARVEVVRSREDAEALLRRWGAYEIDVIQ